jgi:hypothetical protein
VQRYAALNEEEPLLRSDIEVRYVVANPGSYLYLTGNRPFSTDGCDGYDNYKYGMASLPESLSYTGLDRGAIQAQLVSRPLYLLLGVQDNDPNSSNLDHSCKADAQGLDRLQRGSLYFSQVKTFDPDANHTKIEIAGVGHDAEAIFNATDGRRVILHTQVNQPPALFHLSVANGSDGGDYTKGEQISVSTDPAPAGEVFDGWSGDTGYLADPAQATTRLRLSGGMQQIDAEVEMDEMSDPDTTNNSTSVELELPSGADMRVQLKRIYPRNPKVGRMVVYRVRSFNDGPETARGASMTFYLPDDVELVSHSSGCGPTPWPGEVRCDFGDLKKNRRRTRYIRFRPPEPGEMGVSAEVESGLDDPDTDNNQASGSFNVK